MIDINIKYICDNQQNWCEQYNTKHSIQRQIRNLKKRKSNVREKEYKAQIVEDLKNTH